MTLRRTEGNELTCMSRDKNVESDKTMSRLSGKRFEFHSLYKEVPQGKVHKNGKISAIYKVQNDIIGQQKYSKESFTIKLH